MNKMMKRLTGVLICLTAICCFLLLPARADAATKLGDDSYEDLALLYSPNGCTSSQGMGVSDKYVYAIQIRGDNSMAVITCVDRETGKTRVLKNAETGRTYFTDWGHANDMDVLTVDGVDYVFVSGNKGLMMYEMKDYTLTLKTTYQVKIGNQNFYPGGFSFYDVSDTHFTFIMKNGYQLYTAVGTIGVEQETIKARSIGRIDVSQVEIDGEIMSFEPFVNQGMHFRDNILYFVTTGCYKVETINQSVILGYYVGDTTLPLQPEPDLIFFVESDIRSSCFEMESCGVSPDGRLYFNTNSTSPQAKYNRDGVHVFKESIFSRPHGERRTYTLRFEANGGTGVMEDATATYERKTAIPANTFTHDTLVFNGWQVYRTQRGEWLYIGDKGTAWYTEENAPEGYTKYVYGDEATIFDCSDADGDVVVFHAQWRQIGYRLRFNENGGRGMMGDQMMTAGESAALMPNTLTNPEGVFLGWTARRKSDATVYCVNVNDSTDKKWMDEDAMGADYVLYRFADGEEVKALSAVDGDRVEFFADWGLYGDANSDGELTAADVLALRCYASGCYPLPAARAKAMDVNGDGVVNAADVICLLLHIGGALEKLPVGE